MSLTILVHRQLSRVAIVRWFLDPKVSISYATGPLVQMDMREFRAGGWDWIRKHFEEYDRVRLREEQATPVFEPVQEKSFLKHCLAVRVKKDPSGALVLIPQVFTKYTLSGLESLDKKTHRTISPESSAETFWRAFEDVLAIASED